MTPEEEARRALHGGTLREGLSPAGQAEYDRLLALARAGMSGAAAGGMAGERCELTDLLVESCGHCNGAEARAAQAESRPAATASGPGPRFPARYEGNRCAGCGEDIRPGDTIRADGSGGYLCEDCGEEDPAWGG